MKGSTIREGLARVRMTQTKLAKLLGITPQAVTGILAASDVRTGTVERICEVLNLPLSFFYGDENTVINNPQSDGKDGANERQRTKEEAEKDREIEYLRGQIAAYENALSLLSKG